jgi:hypothetical protein
MTASSDQSTAAAAPSSAARVSEPMSNGLEAEAAPEERERERWRIPIWISGVM